MKKLHFPQNRYKEVMNLLKRQAQLVTADETFMVQRGVNAVRRQEKTL